MKAKLFVSFLIATILVATFALATITSVSPSVVTLEKSTNATITINGDTDTYSFQPSQFTQNGRTINFILSHLSGNSYTLRTTGDVREFPIGDFSVAGNIVGVNSTDPEPLTVNFRSGFCEFGQVGTNLSIRDVNIDSDGDDDEEWVFLDTITVEVKVKNNGDDSIKDVVVELGLFDGSGVNKINDLDFSNSDEEQIKLNTIRDGDDKTATFEFRVPADFDSGSYRLAVKAYSDDSGESHDCADEFDSDIAQSISVDDETDEERSIVVDDIKLPQEISCGETASGEFTVFNIGSDDQDQVLTKMTSTELKLNQDFVIRDDLNAGDDKKVPFSFEVPNNLRDGSYTIQFNTFSDYDDRADDYDTESADPFIATLRVVGCSGSSGSGSTGSGDASVTVSPSLASEAKSGEPLIVTLRLRNTASEASTAVVGVSGYESWAELSDISDRIVELEAGESKTVTLTLDVNGNAKGAQSFIVETTVDGVEDTQEVEVNLSNATSTGSFNLGGNSLIWIIGAINVILLILVIAVAVRFARK